MRREEGLKKFESNLLKPLFGKPEFDLSSILSLTSRNFANFSSSDPTKAAGSSNDQCNL